MVVPFFYWIVTSIDGLMFDPELFAKTWNLLMTCCSILSSQFNHEIYQRRDARFWFFKSIMKSARVFGRLSGKESCRPKVCETRSILPLGAISQLLDAVAALPSHISAIEESLSCAEDTDGLHGLTRALMLNSNSSELTWSQLYKTEQKSSCVTHTHIINTGRVVLCPSW